MSSLPRILAALFFPALLFSHTFRDHTHYSGVFRENRSFRVYCPPDYDSSGVKTYPVIYYCHGCAGSYLGDSYTSYRGDGGYTHPYADRPDWSFISKPFNADFQMFVDSHDVIIVMADGTGYGCDAWVSPAYNFVPYFRELVRLVDSLYRTRAEPRYRAISGLSMGGDGALWISSQNPDLFQSASSFCYSPSFKTIGLPPCSTVSDPQQLWRNYRGLSMRTHGNTQDYLGRFSQQMGLLLNGAGFPNEYLLNGFFRHWACHVDSQFDFHMRTFETPKPSPACFSFITLYPDFDAWGYTVVSEKAEPGWLYLKDVTKSSLGIHTRCRLPYGKGLSRFGITLTSPAIYQANASYLLTAYDYRAGTYYSKTISADGSGRLVIADSVGLGREYGLSGNGLEPAVALLADTVNECIYLKSGADSTLSFDMVNLTPSALADVRMLVKSDNSFIRVVDIEEPPVLLQGVGRGAIKLNGSYTKWDNIGYIRVSFAVGGDTLDKEHVIQVHVMDSLPYYDSTKVTVYENGNVVDRIDTGKVYSIWITYPYQDVPNNYYMTAPIVPINGRNNPDITFLDYNLHLFDRARQLVEAKFRLNRHPTDETPITLPFMVELIYTDESPGSDKGIDEHIYRYGKIILPFSAIGVEESALRTGLPLSVTVSPNPFNPVTKIIVTLPAGLRPETMAIYSADGRKVRAFAPKSLGTRGELVWDGKDGRGEPLPSGLYLFRACAQGRSARKAVVYLK